MEISVNRIESMQSPDFTKLQRVADEMKISLSSKAIRYIKETHTSTLKAAQVAKEAGVDKLLLKLS